MSAIGDNIRIIRKRKGMTQEELAMQIGVTPQAISRWEAGGGLPDISMIVPLAQVLSVSTDMIFGMNDSSYNEADFWDLKDITGKMFSFDRPFESSVEICEFLLDKIQKTPNSYEVLVLFVEKTADLSRYVGGFSKQPKQEDEKRVKWNRIREYAVKYGMQVIRFSNLRQLEEKVHFALAWIYMHECDFASARTHIEALPSVASDRLQERLLGYLAFYEEGFNKQKDVVMKNFQNLVRTVNKEMLYFMQTYCTKAPEEAVFFSKWAIKVIKSFMENDYMRISCTGILRDFHKYTIRAYLKRQRIEEAANQWTQLKEDMKNQHKYFQLILNDRGMLEKYTDHQISHMDKYTEEFMNNKQKEILEQIKRWHAKEVYEAFVHAID